MALVIEIQYDKNIGKWIADRPDQKDNPTIGLGSTPLEALGDLVCNNCADFGVIVRKLNLTRANLKNPQPGGLQNHNDVVD